MLDNKDSQYYKNIWRMQSWSVPDFPGSKTNYYSIVTSLINLLSSNHTIDPESCPIIEGIETRPWREYFPFLNSMGLIVNKAGEYYLTETGESFFENTSESILATIMQKRIRLFGEVLEIIDLEPNTVQGVNESLCSKFDLDWTHVHNTRRRMDWLEVLGLINAIGGRKWELTEAGHSALATWELITPELIQSFDNVEPDISISPAPEEISSLLNALRDDVELQKDRSTYNIWVPSPNRIENLRSIVSFSKDRVDKNELFGFISKKFNLKTSSVESMLPFLRVSGLVEEVGRNVYQSTPAAKAWCETNDSIDFIRILHSKMRYVGEIINFAGSDTTRNAIYQEGKKFGMNVEKSRWIVGFLLEAGLVEEPHYLHIKATNTGLELLKELPLANPDIYKNNSNIENSTENDASKRSEPSLNKELALLELLKKASVDPVAEGYICSINKIKYISIDERLPEEESIAQVRAAFAAAHVYIDSPSAKDLEYIRKWFIRWKQQ